MLPKVRDAALHRDLSDMLLSHEINIARANATLWPGILAVRRYLHAILWEIWPILQLSPDRRATFRAQPPLRQCGRVTWRRPCPALSDATLPARPYARSRGNLGAGFLFQGLATQAAIDHREQPARDRSRSRAIRKPPPSGQRLDTGEVVLVGILRVNALAFG